MHILIVFACYMASTARSAPLPQPGPLVEDQHFQEILQRSRSLTQKILLSIPDTHKSCIHMETLQLNSSENAKLVTMASTIGIPPAPVLRAISENFPLECSLRRMHEGLLLHRGLLSSVSPQLEVKDKVGDLMADVRDLAVQIKMMLKMVQSEASVEPTTAPVSLRLPGDYEVQVAAHLTLVQLQTFGQDVLRILRSLDRSEKEEDKS
ncbi:granulocyte colony-stimulating factor [Kryptolebias marmoratus]|uniref:Colony stimulating factor 3 n=1 Tax=Kryptolebias marmoratus TaxID=37003 RepID=A0A3Q3FME5_KRYMA|nr:granulocyte colony-stimulating factor [Kryptolebias marmoratus]